MADKLSRHVRSVSDEKLRDLLKCALTVEDKEREIISVADLRMTSPLQERSFYRYVHKAFDQKLLKASGRGFYKFTPDGKETVLDLLTGDNVAVRNAPTDPHSLSIESERSGRKDG